MWVLHNRSLNLVAEMRWNHTGIQRLFAVDYESDRFIHTDITEENVVLKYFRLYFAMKDKYLHLMLALNEEIDDDLIQKTLTLLQ